MIHGVESMSTADKRRENKVVGFNVKMLDDGSYLLRTQNKSYEHEKEYSYEGMDNLVKEIKTMFGKMSGEKKEKYDALDREKE